MSPLDCIAYSKTKTQTCKQLSQLLVQKSCEFLSAQINLLPFMRVLRSDVHILRLYAVFYIFYFLRNANSHRIAAITLTQSSAMTLCAALSG